MSSFCTAFTSENYVLFIMTGKTSTLKSGPVTATQYFSAHEMRAISWRPSYEGKEHRGEHK